MIPTEIIKAIFFGKEVQIMDTLIAQSKASEWGKLDTSYRQAQAMYEQVKKEYPKEWIEQFMTPFFTEY
jgi:hypothetical protein